MTRASKPLAAELVARKPPFPEDCNGSKAGFTGNALQNGEFHPLVGLRNTTIWETGRNVWWRFTRKDGAPWGLAGVWNTWVDRATGEIHESCTMLTINADAHPLMRRMHKPDLKYGPDDQDKRSVVAIEQPYVDRWLHGKPEDVRQLVTPPAIELIEGTPIALKRA